MWQLINDLTNNKIKENAIVNKLIINNKSIINPTEICKHFNNFFVNVGPTLASQIPR
jgi:hypothetical protein